MKKLCSTRTELKKSVAQKKRMYIAILLRNVEPVVIILLSLKFMNRGIYRI